MPPFFDRQQKRRSGSEVLVPISRHMAMFRRNVAVCLKRREFDGKIITSYDTLPGHWQSTQREEKTILLNTGTLSRKRYQDDTQESTVFPSLSSN